LGDRSDFLKERAEKRGDGERERGGSSGFTRETTEHNRPRIVVDRSRSDGKNVNKRKGVAILGPLEISRRGAIIADAGV
jgi:hypothetical protein